MAVFARLASRLNPEFVVMENVPELLAARYWPFFVAARRVFVRAGYHVRARIYNMAEFGVPQERFRAVIIASKRPFSMPSGFLDRVNFRTVRQAIGHLPPVHPGEKLPRYPMHFTAWHRPSTIRTIKQVPKVGGSRPFEAGPDSLRRAYYRQGKEAFEDVYGRLHWDRPSITITHYSRNPASGRFVHPEQHRGLSAMEAALLQGFPKKYWFEGSLDDKFRQIGDAVPPRFSAYLAAHVLGEVLSPHPPSDRIEEDVRRPVGSSFSRMIGGLKNGKGGGA
jgi:DNA (cytosine-5)-methyltransferase 1